MFTMTRNIITAKRFDAIKYITTTAFGVGAITNPPKLGGEIPAQFAVGVADFLMCTQIFKIYNDKEISTDDVLQSLLKAGIVTIVGGIVVYVGIKISQGIINELTNAAGPIAWAIQSGMAMSSTVLIGVAWLMIVDKQFRSELQLGYVATGDW